jgi:hypothetical protein
LDLGSPNKFKDMGSDKYVQIALHGKIKGEHHDRCHLLPCSLSTGSGINIRSWVRRLMLLKSREWYIDGPAISDKEGKVCFCQCLDDLLEELLEELLETQPGIFREVI